MAFLPEKEISMGAIRDALGGAVNIGSNSTSQAWGRIARIIYYSRHLSDLEITHIYNASKQTYGI